MEFYRLGVTQETANLRKYERKRIPTTKLDYTTYCIKGGEGEERPPGKWNCGRQCMRRRRLSREKGPRGRLASRNPSPIKENTGG